MRYMRRADLNQGHQNSRNYGVADGAAAQICAEFCEQIFDLQQSERTRWRPDGGGYVPKLYYVLTRAVAKTNS